MPDRFIFYPFRIGAQGLALTDNADQHLRDKVEALLFTAPGERVNNPDFGVGLNKAVFETLNDLTVTALEFRITHGLQVSLGNEIIVQEVNLVTDQQNASLVLRLTFRLRTDQKQKNLEIKL